jgi:uncharacterized Tic20 family protein
VPLASASRATRLENSTFLLRLKTVVVMETFEIDAAPASAEGEAAAEPVKRGIPRVVVRALRVVMALCAVLSVIVGVILVILGATQRFSPDVAETMLINNTAANSTAREALQRAFDDEAKLFNNPFAGVAGLGCAMTVWSVAGFVGAFVFSPDTEWRRSFATGFAGFSVAIVAADFFVACLCFVFGRLTVAYVTIYWPYIAKSVHPMTMAEASEYVETHLNWMGWITLLVIVVHVAMLGITSTLVGWRHMISRMQTFLTLTLAFGSLCVIGVCVWSSQYAPWLDTHGSVLLTWMVAACCLATIFIAIVGAATSMAMGDKPQAGWLGAVGALPARRPRRLGLFACRRDIVAVCELYADPTPRLHLDCTRPSTPQADGSTHARGPLGSSSWRRS